MTFVVTAGCSLRLLSSAGLGRLFHSLWCAQKLKLTDWMLVMCKLSEVQMSDKLKAVAEEADPLKEQLQSLVDENKQQKETIEQQKSVISGINALLKESAK
jgi:hypothetical protein